MLKIRDEVDLKELEKYGFKEYKKFYKRYKKVNILLLSTTIENKIYKGTKLIFSKISYGFYLDNYANFSCNDLIKADLVEKVDE